MSAIRPDRGWSVVEFLTDDSAGTTSASTTEVRTLVTGLTERQARRYLSRALRAEQGESR